MRARGIELGHALQAAESLAKRAGCELAALGVEVELLRAVVGRGCALHKLWMRLDLRLRRLKSWRRRCGARYWSDWGPGAHNWKRLNGAYLRARFNNERTCEGEGGHTYSYGYE